MNEYSRSGSPGGSLPEVPSYAKYRVPKESNPGFRAGGVTKFKPEDESAKKLSFIEETFIREFVKDFNATRAARRVGLSRDYYQQILKLPHVRRKLDEIQEARSRDSEIEQKEIITYLANILKADLSEIIEHYRGCCRYCWGHNKSGKITHAFQYKSKRERKLAREKFNSNIARRKEAKFPNGGLGYDKYRIPNPDCPECEGDGKSVVVIKDTNTYSTAKHLIKSINVNSQGKVDLELHDKLRVAEMLMRHLGMFDKDKSGDINVTIQGGLEERIEALRNSGSLEQLEEMILRESKKRVDNT